MIFIMWMRLCYAWRQNKDVVLYSLKKNKPLKISSDYFVDLCSSIMWWWLNVKKVDSERDSDQVHLVNSAKVGEFGGQV